MKLPLACPYIDALTLSAVTYISVAAIEEVACDLADALLHSPAHFDMFRVVAPSCAEMRSASSLRERLTGDFKMCAMEKHSMMLLTVTAHIVRS